MEDRVFGFDSARQPLDIVRDGGGDVTAGTGPTRQVPHPSLAPKRHSRKHGPRLRLVPSEQLWLTDSMDFSIFSIFFFVRGLVSPKSRHSIYWILSRVLRSFIT